MPIYFFNEKIVDIFESSIYRKDIIVNEARTKIDVYLYGIAGSGGNKKLAEALLTSASQVESLTPQLVNAGRIRMSYPESKAADVHFENLRQQYAETMQRARALCDEATDSADFVRTSEEQMQKHSFLCEEAIAKTHPQKMVDNTAAIARLANRVILVAKQESDNSEDPAFIQRVNQAADVLQHSKIIELRRVCFCFAFSL